MFTTIDKALVALFGAILTILTQFFPALSFLADPDIQTSIITLLTAAVVYQIPNKKVE